MIEKIEKNLSDFYENVVNVVNSDPKWELLHKLYDENYYNKKGISKEEKIPKIIHQVWLGGKIPEKYITYRNKMMEINKGWEYKLWTDADVDVFELKNIKLFNNIKNLGAKSDIFRYEILERFGGVYIDTDFDCVKPFDDLLHLDAFAGNGHAVTPEVFNSIMASIPNHKYMSAIVRELQKIENFNDDINGVMYTTGPYFVSRVFYDTISESDNVVIFPTKFFFPFPINQRHIPRNDKYNSITNSFNNENTYCCHLWHTTWQ